ncbi:MAG TPA: hypothetical protein VK738_17795 [Terriglobales bacterium]|jgi:hypothetical protein|nr:hypothetical protein [Terriglobales bacterium]
MNATLSTLIKRLYETRLSKTNVIPWSCPVPSFGDVSSARVATLGLNPSNREFVDRSGNELVGPFRRFHTLGSLGLARWSEVKVQHLRQIWDSCRNYFSRNPYDLWFRQLDHLIGETEASYYDASGGACHLDLIPYATECKWTSLSHRQRSLLISVAGDSLALLLRESPVRLLILNGSSVVRNFEKIAEVRLEKKVMNGWMLPRRSRSNVTGIAYNGVVRYVSGIKLKHDVLVIGFNHNIQSSFGVTREVRTSIRHWIGRIADGVCW